MALIPNPGTTAFQNVTVRVQLTGTGVAANDTVRVYNSGAQVATKTIDATDISNGYADVGLVALIDGVYNINAALQNAGGISPHSAVNYVVTVAAGAPPPMLLFNEDWTTLDLKSSGNPLGRWMPLDFWQDINSLGYEDFAGLDTWNVNPNNPAISAHNPFSVSGNVLTITSTLRNTGDAALAAAIQASMNAQGIPGPVPSWLGGMLITNPDTVTFRYGYFEARIRWPNPGKGMFPAWWLYNARGGPKPTSEIDILEIFGDVGAVYHTSIHSTRGFEAPGSPVNGDTTSYHNYAMDWQPTSLKFYKDQVLYGTVTGADATYFDQNLGLRINFAMNAPWFPPVTNKSDGSTPSPMRLECASIKVWDRNPYI